MPEPDTVSYAAATDLASVRAFVRDRAAGYALPPYRVEMLILAVSELATNTLQHTAAGGEVRVWAEAGQIVVDIIDRGAVRVVAGEMPPPDALRGRGLVIVAQVCDEISTQDGLVRLRMNL
jgi:serine/threonine-protein kinase RsbW